MSLLLLAIGLVGLTVGGDLLVSGSVAVARHFGLSPMVIGLTLVSFGTSSPELLTSLQAALIGSPGIAVGNIVGSNICNILLVLGGAALLRPVPAPKGTLRREGAVLALASLLCLGAVLAGSVGRLTGTAFLLLLAAFVTLTLRAERRRGGDEADGLTAVGVAAELSGARQGSVLLFFLRFLLGLVLTIFGARLLVHGAIDVATTFGVSEAVIGVTVVAIGTSLPEMMTAWMSSLRGHGDLGLGNIVGANIFNVLCNLGATAVVRPIAVPAEIARFDIWVMLTATAALLLFAGTAKRIGRAQGGALLAGYAAYLGLLVANV